MNKQEVNTKLEEQLRSMHYKNYMINGFVVKLLSWKYEGEYCTVVTSRPWITRPQNEMLKVLRTEFLETDEEPEDAPQSKLPVPADQLVEVPRLKSLETCDTFMDALSRAMGEVEKNPAFKDQAQVMTNIAGKAIDYAKVQLDAYRLARDIVRNR